MVELYRRLARGGSGGSFARRHARDPRAVVNWAAFVLLGEPD
jgi:hypothetical protein